MALAQTLQEQLTCPICQDIFTDPMVLKCHHSLCQECLEGLKNASMVRWKVECPVCRNPCKTEEIQRDFRTITLLDAHKNQGGHSDLDTLNEDDVGEVCSTEGVRLCDLCHKDPIRQRCKQCDKILCQRCSTNHKSIPACKDHTLQGLKEDTEKEKASLKNRHNELKKQEVGVDAKLKEIQEYQQNLEAGRDKAIEDINQWYDSMVQRAAKQRDHMIHKIKQSIDSEMTGVAEKQQIVSSRQDSIKESLSMIQTAQAEDDPAVVLGTIDKIRKRLDLRSMDDSPHDLSKMVIPSTPDVKVHLGKRWDESKAIHVSIKKHSTGKHLPSLPTFPNNLASGNLLVKDRDLKVKKGVKQILMHHGLLWCMYDDHIDIYDKHDRIIKTISQHTKIPNGMVSIPNGNMVVACMSEGLLEFTSKGKFVGLITDGNICDVTSDHKLVYSLDYTDNRPFLKAFKKRQFKWKKVIDHEIQNDKCNTFNTILSNQTSIFVSATEENVLIEYNREGDLVSRLDRPSANHLCCSDIWGNILLTNFQQHQVWMFKTNQTWERVCIDGINRPYSVTVDDDGGLWVSNNSDTLSRYTCPVQTL